MVAGVVMTPEGSYLTETTQTFRQCNEVLFAWLHKARELAQEKGRLEWCDSRIGTVFARAPKDPDGTWPCIPVRDALEEIGTEDVFSGFEVGIFNKRGVVSKSSTEGGEKERSLAKQFHDYAEACKFEWPKTAASLRRMAQTYEEDAKREDAEAELRD